jgi:hypothetical protein
MRNATKYTIRISDINIPLIQVSQLDRLLIFFDWNLTRNGISYLNGGSFQFSACDNNWIWLDSLRGGTGQKLQAGTNIFKAASAPAAINTPVTPYNNDTFCADATTPTPPTTVPWLGTVGLPVFNLWNYNNDLVSNLYLVLNPDPNDGTQAVGQIGSGARLRCIVEASFAPQY